MLKEAILHIPLSQYAFAENEHKLVIRLRTAKNDCKECVLFYGDRADPNKDIRLTRLPMEVAGSDMYFDYYEAVIQDKYTRVCYYFFIKDDVEALYYFERGLFPEIDCSRTEYFQFPFIRREDIMSTPSWAKDMVMYHIFPNSFATSNKYISGKEDIKQVILADGSVAESVTNLGGTLRGVTENISYLADLGINCIYLNPIFAANSYHKYDTIDYFEVDPCFGTKDDLKNLVKTCHENGIRVLFDGVFNHCGADFFAFVDVLKKGKDSKYFDWFYDLPDVVEYKDPPEYAAFAYVKEMPKLNTSNPELEEYLIKVGTYWIEEVGIDGWRLDVANEINHDFWRHFRSAVRKVKPDALLIGEIWEDSGVWLMGDQMDSTMNYRFTYLCMDFFARQNISVTEFDEAIHKMIFRYQTPTALAQMNFLDSHDVPRFLSYCEGDRRKMKLAFAYLLMGYGVPSIFYGDEYFIEGVEEPEYRKAMPWGSSDNMIDELRYLIQFRRKHSAIRNGKYKTIYRNDEKNIYVFARQNEDEIVYILLNNSDDSFVITGELSEKINRKLAIGDIVEGYTYRLV